MSLPFADVDLDADLAQEGRGPAQPAAESRGIGGPGLGSGGFLPRDAFKQVQQVRGGPGPLVWFAMSVRTAVATRLASRTRLHRLVDVAAIGLHKGAVFPGRAVLVPERGLAGRRPDREIGHARQPLQPDLG